MRTNTCPLLAMLDGIVVAPEYGHPARTASAGACVTGATQHQRALCLAIGCSERTLRRHQERYHDGGMAALATRSGWRPGRRRVPTKRLRIIEGLQADGMSNREIARRMGVTEKAIRKEVGPSERRAQQQSLPLDTTENSGGTASAMSTVTSAEPTPPSPMGQALPLVSA